MFTTLAIGTVMIVAAVVFHVAGLVALSSALTAAGPHLDDALRPLRAIGLFVPSVLVILLLHVVEAWSWAALFVAVGEFDNFESALYFSTVTATTLGYGDVTLSETWRLVGAFEAMGGLILFAASTAFLLELMREALGIDSRS